MINEFQIVIGIESGGKTELSRIAGIVREQHRHKRGTVTFYRASNWLARKEAVGETTDGGIESVM